MFDFNSIKVRLELNQTSVNCACDFLFQFHKGTIRTLRENRQNLADNYFNSIKVRLELTAGATYCSVTNTFQFHKGTIRTQHLPSER